MDRCNIGRRLLTPTIGISGIIAVIYHLSFAGIFILFFRFYHFFPIQSNNIYHILYYMKFEIHSHQPFNQCLFFFGFLDNTFIAQSILSFNIINTLITVLMSLSILLVFSIIVTIFNVFHFFNRIIAISMWCIIFIRLWIICSFRIIFIILV